jgi:hypothetical protein
MKKLYNKSRPLLFAIFSFTFYYVIYRPQYRSEDFTTACLVFSSILAWTAIITLIEEEKSRGVMAVYIAIAILIPIVGIQVFEVLPLQPVWHPFLLGLLGFSVPCLMLWVTASARSRRKC